MIISDTDFHKLDVKWCKQDDGAPDWLQITSFHAKSDTEWVIKTIRLSSESTNQLFRYLQGKTGSIGLDRKPEQAFSEEDL